MIPVCLGAGAGGKPGGGGDDDNDAANDDSDEDEETPGPKTGIIDIEERLCLQVVLALGSVGLGSVGLGSVGRGIIDVEGRLCLQIEPAIEWRCVFNEAWRHAREQLYRAVDEAVWLEARTKYGALVDNAGCAIPTDPTASIGRRDCPAIGVGRS